MFYAPRLERIDEAVESRDKRILFVLVDSLLGKFGLHLQPLALPVDCDVNIFKIRRTEMLRVKV